MIESDSDEEANAVSAATTHETATGAAPAEAEHTAYCPEGQQRRLLRNGGASAPKAGVSSSSLQAMEGQSGSSQAPPHSPQSRGAGEEKEEGQRERANTDGAVVRGRVSNCHVHSKGNQKVPAGGGKESDSGGGAVITDAECRACSLADDIMKATHRCAICGPMCEVQPPPPILRDLLNFCNLFGIIFSDFDLG